MPWVRASDRKRMICVVFCLCLLTCSALAPVRRGWDHSSQCVDLAALGLREDAVRCLLHGVRLLTSSGAERAMHQRREHVRAAALGASLASRGSEHLKAGRHTSAATALRAAVRIALQHYSAEESNRAAGVDTGANATAPPCDLLMELGIAYEVDHDHSAAADSFHMASALCPGVPDLMAMEGSALVNDAIEMANAAAEKEEAAARAAAGGVGVAATGAAAAEWALAWRARQQRGLALLQQAHAAEGQGEQSLARTILMRVDPCIVANSQGGFAALLAEGGALAAAPVPATWEPQQQRGRPWLQRLPLPAELQSRALQTRALPAAMAAAEEEAAAAVVLGHGLLPAAAVAALNATLVRHASIFDAATYAGSVDKKPARMISVLKATGFRTGATEWNELCAAVRRRAAPAIAAALGATTAATPPTAEDVLAGRVLRLRECFVRKYTTTQRRGLAPHADASALTINVLLTPRAAFRTVRGGAGPTLFGFGGASGNDYDRSLYAEVSLEHGDALLHSGALLHGAEELISGDRLVLVLFLGNRTEIEREYSRHGKVPPETHAEAWVVIKNK